MEIVRSYFNLSLPRPNYSTCWDTTPYNSIVSKNILQLERECPNSTVWHSRYTFHRQSILVSYNRITSYHKFNGCKQFLFISSWFCRLEDQHSLAGFRVSQDWNQSVGWAEFLSGGSGGEIHCQAHSGYWQNLVPCDFRTKIPVSLLNVIWVPHSACQQRSHSLPSGRSSTSNHSGTLHLWPPLLSPDRENCLPLRLMWLAPLR